ncbi:MAG TPA: FtsX-like permease family protein [Enhygromyxa sp.]|nr:FtsX-like permease family protein [Enhygromyxa sp.]
MIRLISRALDRKAVRELVHMRGQIIAIVLVLACGIAAFVAMISNLQALDRSMRRYYEHNHFADVFARLVRAPESLAQSVAALPGVARVETRLVEELTLGVEGYGEPITGRLISLSPNPDEGLNRLVLRKGRLPLPDADDEVAALESFAIAHGLEPGDSIAALINGRYQQLEIVGLVLSPEYIYVLPPGGAFPDPARFGLLWADRSMLAAAYDMQGSFDDVVVDLVPGADERAFRQRLDLLLAPWGGIDSVGRDMQMSNRLTSMEIDQLRSQGVIVPAIFLGVAAFLLNVVLTRLISTQREQIAALKAVGYGNFTIALHYAKIVALIVLLGAALGIAIGGWLGRAMSNMYLMFFAFPVIEFRLEPSLLIGAVLVGLLAGGIGAANAVRKAVKLPPAEAMRPPAPSQHGRSLIDRLKLILLFGPAGRMVVRNLAQRPLRAVMTSLGISMAVAILVVGNFSKDSLDYLVYVQFGLAQRYDLQVDFNQPLDERAVRELEHLPGVMVAEPFRAVPVRLRSGSRTWQVGIQGLEPDSSLRQLLDEDLNAQPIPEAGVLLTSNLAEKLDVRVGDPIDVEVLEGDRPVRTLVVAATVDELVGVSAYMDRRALNRMMREGTKVSGAWLSVDPEQLDALYQQLRRTPAIAGVNRLEGALEAFEETSKQIQMTARSILLIFASVIAVGVVYNSARITLSERSRELASLRVIGFSKAEVSTILLGEFAILLLAAIPIGWAIGWYLAYAAMAGVDSDLYQFPLIIQPSTYAMAALVVIIAGVATALLVRRRINNLDLVAVLKTRE